MFYFIYSFSSVLIYIADRIGGMGKRFTEEDDHQIEVKGELYQPTIYP